MNHDDKLIESLITGGIIGAKMGALVSNNKEEGDTIGDLMEATLIGTYNANKKAKETRLPMVIEENGKLFQLNADGTRQFIRNIEKPTIKLQKHFKLT